jgi:hypothetical protein
MTMKRIVLSWIRFVSVAEPFALLLIRRTRPVKIDTSFEKPYLQESANLASGEE